MVFKLLVFKLWSLNKVMLGNWQTFSDEMFPPEMSPVAERSLVKTFTRQNISFSNVPFNKTFPNTYLQTMQLSFSSYVQYTSKAHCGE